MIPYLAPDAAMPRAHRLVLVAIAVLAVPMVLILGETYSSLRLFETLASAAGKPWREAADVLFHHAKDTLVAKFCGDEDEDHEAGEGEGQGDAS